MPSSLRSIEYIQQHSEITEYFDVISKIGQGTFASVFQVKVKHDPTNKPFALKMIIPTVDIKRIENEIRILQRVGGKHNVIELLACNRIFDHIFILMPYFEHSHFSEFYLSFNEKLIKRYLHNLLKALAHVHEFGIIHRDIKPTNFLYNPNTEKFKLVDFGLAHSEKFGDLDKKWGEDVNDENEQLNNSKSGSRRCFFSLEESVSKRPALHNPILSSSSVLSNIAFNTVNFGKKIPESSTNILKEKSKQFSNFKSTGCTSSSLSATTSNTFASTLSSSTNMSSSHNSTPKECICGLRLTTCKVCRSLPKPIIQARRGGTLGFRPPEVMMRCINQTTAVDIWAGGIIFLSFLTARYPFIKVEDDLDVLHAFTHLLGYWRMQRGAKAMGKIFIADPLPKDDPETELKSYQYLKAHCVRIRSSEKKLQPEQEKDDKAKKRVITLPSTHIFPSSAYDLLYRMLEPNPFKRISAKDALNHTYFTGKRLLNNNNNNKVSSLTETSTQNSQKTESPQNPDRVTESNPPNNVLYRRAAFY